MILFVFNSRNEPCKKRAWYRTIFLLYIRTVASEVACEIHAVEHAHFIPFKVKICSTNIVQA